MAQSLASLFVSCCVVNSWALGSSAAGTLGVEQAKETLKIAGTRLLVESARVKRRRRICLKLYAK